MGGLSLKFKTLNGNERPTMRLLCCLYAYKAHFLLFHEVSEVIFETTVLK